MRVVYWWVTRDDDGEIVSNVPYKVVDFVNDFDNNIRFQKEVNIDGAMKMGYTKQASSYTPTPDQYFK